MIKKMVLCIIALFPLFLEALNDPLGIYKDIQPKLQQLVEWTRHAQDSFEKAEHMRLRFQRVNRHMNTNELDLLQIQQNWYNGIVHLYHATRDISRDVLESITELKRQLAILQKEDAAGAALPTQQMQEIESRARTMKEISMQWMMRFRNSYADIMLPKRIFDEQYMPPKGSEGHGNIEGSSGYYRDSMPFYDPVYFRY